MSKRIPIQDLPKHIKGLSYDDDLRLHYDGHEGMYNWTAKTKKEYQAIEKRIDKIGRKGKGFQVYAWCDVSGFDYWVKRQQEPNYIQISVVLDKPYLTETQIKDLEQAIDDAACTASGIAYQCEDEVWDLYNKAKGASNE